ncbi:MAG: CvpA family protein [Clostridia bacterium]|nr:CvpA family protein [Clostridia bacterium]
MDYILLAFVVLFFLRGCIKGAVSMLFSLAGVAAIAIISWKLSELLLPYVQEMCGESVFDFLKNAFDEKIVGNFADVEQLKNTVAASEYNLFGVLLIRLLGDLSFEGELTAGQILAPSISKLLLKVATFIVAYVVLYLFLKILQKIINKIIKKCGLSVGDRMLGGMLGLIKGVFLFGVVYFAIASLANLLLNEALLNFVQNGQISKFVYDNFIAKIIEVFY